MQTVIKKILSDRKRFLSLLLLADEQETMIDKYIGRGEKIEALQVFRKREFVDSIFGDEL